MATHVMSKDRGPIGHHAESVSPVLALRLGCRRPVWQLFPGGKTHGGTADRGRDVCQCPGVFLDFDDQIEIDAALRGLRLPRRLHAKRVGFWLARHLSATLE